MKDYDPQEIIKSECIACKWVHDLNPRKRKGKVCENCGSTRGAYREFPSNDSSVHILGGLPHFIKSYNAKLTGPRHYFPPEMYLPILFAASHFEAMVRALTDDIIRCYGKQIGRLGRFIIWQGTMTEKGRYDHQAAKDVFSHLVGKSLDSILAREFKSFKAKFDRINSTRNAAIHGVQVSVPHGDFNKDIDEAIDFIIESISVFQSLQNKFVAKFADNIDVRKILRVSESEMLDF